MNQAYVDHIGIVVENLDRSIELFESLFGLRPSKIKDLPEAGLRVAHLQAQNVEIELLQYTGGNTFGQKVMGGERGINHLSVRVKDIQRALKDSAQKGAKVIDGFPREGSHGQVAFFDPDSTQGILLEICESK
jgi:methylmalonyl-CoA/ethylmalonyl-CoA epimerase